MSFECGSLEHLMELMSIKQDVNDLMDTDEDENSADLKANSFKTDVSE